MTYSFEARSAPELGAFVGKLIVWEPILTRAEAFRLWRETDAYEKEIWRHLKTKAATAFRVKYFIEKEGGQHGNGRSNRRVQAPAG